MISYFSLDDFPSGTELDLVGLRNKEYCGEFNRLRFRHMRCQSSTEGRRPPTKISFITSIDFKASRKLIEGSLSSFMQSMK